MQRFISEDPIGFSSGDTNLYRYANNAPHVASDPNGTNPALALGVPAAAGIELDPATFGISLGVAFIASIFFGFFGGFSAPAPPSPISQSAIGPRNSNVGTRTLSIEINETQIQPVDESPDVADDEDLPISEQKQNSHIKGTKDYENRIKQGKNTSTWDVPREEADRLTREAWRNGTQTSPKNPNIRDYEMNKRIGTGQFGGGQTKVRVSIDGKGRIHGHPNGSETK